MNPQTETPDRDRRQRHGGQDTLSVTDNRTGREYELEITDGTIRGIDLRQIKVSEDDFGLMSYDPAYLNTASCRSSITYIDGDAGILEYRGYPIEQLAERSTYLEVAYLLVHGELPDAGAAGRVDPRDHHPHVRARERQGVHAGLSPRRPPDGDAAGLGRRAVDLLSRRQRDQGPRQPLHPDHPPDRQDADAGGLRLPPLARPAVRLSRQRAGLPGQLPRDALPDDRAQVRARRAAARARWTSSSSCTPTTSRTARPARCAASARRRSTPTRRWQPASAALYGPAARRRQ